MDSCKMNIEIGSKVRSFDFDHRDLEGDNAFYVEGKVVNILSGGVYGCDRYVILVGRQIFQGEEVDYHIGKEILPPVNGIPNLFGGITDGVELL